MFLSAERKIVAGFYDLSRSFAEKARFHIEFPDLKIGTIENINLLGKSHSAPGNNGSVFSGKVEPDSGKAFKKIINAEKSSPFKILGRFICIDSFFRIGLRVIPSGNKDQISMSFYRETVPAEIFSFYPGIPGKSVDTENNRPALKSRFFQHRHRKSQTPGEDHTQLFPGKTYHGRTSRNNSHSKFPRQNRFHA